MVLSAAGAAASGFASGIGRALLLLRVKLAAAAGRSEFGPRALGHRSLLAVAAQPTIREKLNSIKKRK